MLVIKQIWSECRLRKIEKGVVLLIIVDLWWCITSQSWTSSFVCVWFGIDLVKKWVVQKEMPEIVCFLPMELIARQKYARMKGYLEGLLLSFYLMGCLLLSQISHYGEPVNWAVISHTLLVGFDYFMQCSERSVMEENARYRRLEPDLFRKMCCPGWYRILYYLTGGIRVLIWMSSFYWCMLQDGERFMSIFPWQWILALCCLAAGLLVMHVFRMRHILYTVEMGDYNVGGREYKDGGI